MTDPGMVMEITGGILVIVCVLFMAYYGSRRIGKTFQFRNTGKNIQLIESVPVSQGTYLAMARVGERYYLLGIAAGKIDLLKEMPEDYVPDQMDKAENQFKTCMEKFAEKIREGKQ